MKILVVAPIVPYPLHDGDKVRLYHLLKGLCRKHQVSLLACTRDPRGPQQAQALFSFLEECQVIPLPRWRLYLNCLQNLFSPLPFNVTAYYWKGMQRAVQHKAESGCFDLVFAYRLRMAPYVIPLKQKKMLDFTDALSMYMPRVAGQSRSWLKRLFLRWESRALITYETAAGRHFEASLISSPQDQSFLQSQGAPKPAWISNGVNTADFKPVFSGREQATLLFTGNMGYYPNQQGMVYFKADIWPLIKKQVPGVKLRIVGGNVPIWMEQWKSERDIEITGKVESMVPYLQKATLFICPLQVGSGVRFKILEAMAAGIAVVSTSLGCEGLKVVHGKEIAVADTAGAFTERVVFLLDKPAQRTLIGKRALAVCKKYYDWKVIEKNLDKVVAGIR